MLYQTPDGYEIITPAEQRRRAALLKAKFAPVRDPKPVPVTTVKPVVTPLSYVELYALSAPVIPHKTYGEDAAAEIADSMVGRRPATSRLIIKYVARTYGIEVGELKSKRRIKILNWPRHVAAYLLCGYTKLSLPQIGRLLDRYHITIIHAREKVQRLYFESDQVRQEIDAHSFAVERLLGKVQP